MRTVMLTDIWVCSPLAANDHGEVLNPVSYTHLNPPKSVQSWMNTEVDIPRADRVVHHSAYLEVAKEWLGSQFLIEAEHLKKTKPEAYRHEYLGEVTGTGGEVFANVRIEAFTDEQIKRFDNIRQGNDWGYAVDPAAFIRLHYDKTRRRIYIFGEIYSVGMSNRLLCNGIISRQWVHPIPTADSAEPKSIDECDCYGVYMLSLIHIS